MGRRDVAGQTKGSSFSAPDTERQDAHVPRYDAVLMFVGGAFGALTAWELMTFHGVWFWVAVAGGALWWSAVLARIVASDGGVSW